MAADFVLEACVDSLDSALAAKEGGATRLELCANLLIGGTTPMPSLVRRVKAATGLPTHALLRPRFGDFLYTGEEFSLLLEDAAALLEAGADAIVSGFLTPAGDLDRQRLAQLVELCHRAGKRFTLHRAFDMCRDPFAALELCKELGVDTVLTSGQKNTCLEGLPLLEEHPLDLPHLPVLEKIPDLFQRHLQGSEIPDGVQALKLPGAVGPVACSGVHILRGEQADLFIVPQGAYTHPEHPGHLSNGEPLSPL